MISVTLMVKNGEETIEECLGSLAPFEEVLLLDTGSQDRTLELARRFPNVRIVERPFQGFGPTKNLAADLARNDWILSIDSDESLTPELTWSILNQPLDDNRIYRFSRQSYYNRKWIRGCGWSPDYVRRLYNKKRARFNDNMVHENIMVPEGMEMVDLEGALKHYPYRDATSLVEKLQFYSTLFAEQNRGKLRSGPVKSVVHGLGAFFKGYVVRKGFLDGYEGFLISFCQGLATYFKYIKLYEANRKDAFEE